MRYGDLQLAHDSFATHHIRIEHVVAQATETAADVNLDLGFLAGTRKAAVQGQRAGAHHEVTIGNQYTHAMNLPAMVIRSPSSRIAAGVDSTWTVIESGSKK